MKSGKSSVSWAAIAWAALLLCAARVEAAEGKSWKFDCGTADSPVMEGYQRLTGAEAYEKSKGYGWETPAAEGIVFPEAVPNPEWRGSWGSKNLHDYIGKESRNPLNTDGVVSETDLKFRLDVPNGRYRVKITVGDMSQALGSIDLGINGILAASRLAVWSAASYRMFDKAPGPWWRTIRETVDVKDGAIRVVLSKNQKYYDEQMALQAKGENPYKRWYHATPVVEAPPYTFIGYPFKRNSVMAIEATPEVPAPVAGDNATDKIELTRKIESPPLKDAVEKYNAGDYEGAAKALDGATEEDAQVAKALVLLWIAGRLETEREREWIPAAVAILKKSSAAKPLETGSAEALSDAGFYLKAWNIHWTRGDLGKNHFDENDKAANWWMLIPDDSPLHYKTQLQIARAARMLKPYFPAISTEEAMLKDLEKKFPQNRFIRYHLYRQWENKGDGNDYYDWEMEDYGALAGNAPAWVRGVYPAFGHLVDLSEWWVRYRQGPEGTIGGGWGDDVEMVGLFGYYGYISSDASQVCIQGANKLVDGVWNLSEVDPEAGYCAPMADAEHTAEWTGNTLGMMMQIDYGNPLWVERSMKTGKLIRDLWTGINAKGQRHFKSNHFSATEVGVGDQANDSFINYRAVRPATAVLAYNGNPTILKLYKELTDAWVADAMSTDRGKPKGVIPAEVGWPEGTLGGVRSPAWWKSIHTPGTINYDWWDEKTNTGQAYKGLLTDLLFAVYDWIPDGARFEPLRLEYELASKYDGPGAVKKGSETKWDPNDPAGAAEPGSDLWVAARLQGAEEWLDAKKRIDGREGELKPSLTTTQVAEMGTSATAYIRQAWPASTSEAGPTDRVGFVGIVDAFKIYTGGGVGGPLLRAAFTYQNTTKNFAAAVLGSDAQGAKILYYSMAPDEREPAVVPWEFEPGGTYDLKYGIDSDGDNAIDEVVEKRTIEFEQRGQPIPITIKPRMTYVVELEQTKRGRPLGLDPDPAICADDIEYDAARGEVSVRVHNIGSREFKDLSVDFYQGDPEMGGKKLGSQKIQSLDAPLDLEPCTAIVKIQHKIEGKPQDIYVVLDAGDSIKDEITTVNNTANSPLPKPQKAKIEKKKLPAGGGRGGR